MGKTVSKHVPTYTDLSADVRDFLSALPDIAQHLSALQALIRGAFQNPELEFVVVRPAADEDSHPLLSIVVHFREPAVEARRKRRAFLNGPWMELPTSVVGQVALHLGHRLESR